MAADPRTIPQSLFALDWNGKLQGQCKSIDIGKLTGDVYEAKAGSWHTTNKTVANIKWAEATAEVGVGCGKALYEFIKSSFDNKHLYASGAVLIADFDQNVKRRGDFLGALMTEFTIPKLSGESKENGYFTFKWQFESLRWSDGSGALGAPALSDSFKKFRLNNYRLEVGSLPCDLVTEIDSIAFKQKTNYDYTGTVKEPIIIPTQLECGDLKITLSKGPNGSVEKAWSDAAKKWFIDGAHEDKDELTAKITWLGPDLKTELGSMELDHVGFKEFSPAKLERGDKAGKISVTMYVETAKFDLKQAGA